MSPTRTDPALPDWVRPLPAVLQAPVAEALHRVIDPELGEAIDDLGLIGTLHYGDNELRVRLLATSASCPMSDVLLEDALDALTAALRRHKPADMPPLLLNVDIDWDTTWTPERMAPALRERMGW